MRLKTALLWATLLVAIQIQTADAFCLFLCPTTTTDIASASVTGAASTSDASSSVPASSSASSTSISSSITSTSSSSISSTTSSTSSTPTSTFSSATPTTSSSMSSTAASTTSSSPSPSPTEIPAATKSSNTGAIVGGVCGFVALIAAGFAYAFFSKTKRNNKRLQQQNQSMYHDAGYQSDPFDNNRPSPMMAANNGLDHSSPQMHNQQQWEGQPQQQNYNNYGYPMSPPAAPVAAAAVNSQHDPYYAATPMNYNDPYYNQQPQYYDTMGYQQPVYDQHQQPVYDQHQQPVYEQHQQQSYDHQQQPLYDHQQQHYDPYQTPVPMTTPPMVQQHIVAAPVTNSNVYSAPHSYPDDANVNQPPKPPQKQ